MPVLTKAAGLCKNTAAFDYISKNPLVFAQINV